MMKVHVLGSGSSGNSIFVGTDTTKIVIDAGLRKEDMLMAMKRIGERLDDVQAVLITHEHGDHIAGLGAIFQRFLGQIYCTNGTAEGIQFRALEVYGGMKIGDMRIIPFPVDHDAREPVGYAIEGGGERLIVALDLGMIPDCLGADVSTMILECNHDTEMLRACTNYPARVLERIHHNHLSNDQVISFIQDEMSPAVERLLLAHLSQRTNNPAALQEAALAAIRARGLKTTLEIA